MDNADSELERSNEPIRDTLSRTYCRTAVAKTTRLHNHFRTLHIFVNMALVKQPLISFCGGLLLLLVWFVIIALTSQDFTHEGPNSIWFLPIDVWSQVIVYLGLIKSVSSFSPILGVLLGFVMLLSPFVLALSAVVHLASRFLRKMKVGRKLA
jgi:hypothetical protein